MPERLKPVLLPWPKIAAGTLRLVHAVVLVFIILQGRVHREQYHNTKAYVDRRYLL